MDLEIEESEKNAEEIEVVVEKNGKEITKKIKASFKTASQLPRHTRSSKVFHSLYDDENPIALAQFGAGWVDATDERKHAWTTTDDGPRVNILGLYPSSKVAARKGYRMVQLIEKHGYRSYGMTTYPNRSWVVLRRFHPSNVKDDEVLATNIINYTRRYNRLAEIDFGKEIRQKDRPLVKPPENPDTLLDIHPQALKSLKTKTRKLRSRTKQAIANLKKDKSLTRKQFLKAKSKLKQMEHKKLKGMVSHIPSKTRDRKQNYAAVAWVTSPQYLHVDNTKYYGYKAPEENEGQESSDPAPDKIFTKEDFDEAMMLCILRTFNTEEECKEFIDNKAKHDLDFCSVVCMEMYIHTPMDTVLTKEYEAKVPRTYLTELQQKVVVEREERTKAGLKQAEETPGLVREMTRKEDGTVSVPEAKESARIREALEQEKARTDATFEENQRKALEDIQEEEVAGGGSKDEVEEEQVPAQEEEEVPVPQEVEEEKIEN